MTRFQSVSLFLLRVTLGWMFFWAGITKLLDPSWSAAGYLNAAKTFAGFYHFLASPGILPLVNFLNGWGLTLVGAALVLGVFVRLASLAGGLIMVLYYLPILDFPYPNAHSFLVDEHVIYLFVFLVLASQRAGLIWGLEARCANLPICAKYPRLRSLLG